MAFDQTTRNRLARFVKDARDLITGEFTQKFAERFGIAEDGTCAPLEKLTHLDEPGLATAALLRQRIDYLVNSHPKEREGRAAAVKRLAREQAFTVLNRLAALRMAEKRGLILESVGKGYQSKGYKLYATVAGTGLGETYERYRRYLFCLCDELAVDLGALFDRHSPHGILFPREPALLALLDLLNAADLEHLWGEDETIGWIYQYYNDEDERKKMRKDSPAPRNSRELAVRNQFFTPRYVVEFLTDNTLGRIWYEMTQGETSLRERCRYLVRRPTEIFFKPGEAVPDASAAAESLSQEELLKQPVYIPHRPLKDPRELRMLDPACGSMHFGLYAFDLYEVIYVEAWDRGCATLKKDFPDRAVLLRDVPRLIVEHNIHGVDIDPRAAQIATLSLWLRAQKSWSQQGLAAAARPRITRSHVVCAEPMPGDKALLADFVERAFPAAERPVFQHLLDRVFDHMQLAGEAGSLLKIEEEIRTAIEEARALWEKSRTASRELFSTEIINTTLRPGTQQELGGLESAVSQLGAKADFWESAEERIYQALRGYSEQAETTGSVQRRLFANDAAQGFAFIDLCRKRYDVAVMNPPFGLMPELVYRYLIDNYTTSYSDLALAFMSRGSKLCGGKGLVGAITSRAFLNVSDAEKFRSSVALHHMRLLADLGIGVMDDAFVDASAQVLSTSREEALWIKDARKSKDKAESLLRFLDSATDSTAYVFRHSHFSTIPKCRIAYDSGDGLGSLLSSIDSVEPAYGIARTGASTFEDERFLRLIWEMNPAHLGRNKTWCWIARTIPDFCQYYYPFEIASKWNRDGAELCERNRQVNGQIAQARQGSSHYFNAGIVFSRRSRPSIAFRIHPSGNLFSSTCGVVFLRRAQESLFLMGVLNSRFVRAAIHTLTTFSYTVGHIRAILAPKFNESDASSIALLVDRQIKAKQKCFRLFETDHFFYPAQRNGTQTLWEAHKQLCSFLSDTESQMLADAQALDTKVAAVYSLSGEVDTARFGIKADNTTLPKWLTKLSVADFIGNAISELLGSVFGRWDIRYATGELPAPELPDPFAPLTVCPPGMLQGDDGLPLSPEAGQKLRADGHYPINVAWGGILVDDPEHPLDIVGGVQAALASIWKDRAEAIEREACELLAVASLRELFGGPAGFFADHFKRYSKSRRQAPIFWPLSTKSGTYTLWLYYHRLSDQTLHTAIADFVEPKIKAVEATVASARAANRTGELADAQEFLDELRDFKAELERLTKLPWKPNLNDGVLITASPLWKLFRLPKWQKDLKACWEELERGDYDWAHLAHTLRPKEVEEKCKTDRSLAIAHGLEHLCQIEPPKPKTKRGKKANASDQSELTEERE